MGESKSLSMSEPWFELFILSESGKPIYSYHRREDSTSLMGVCVALYNYFQQTQNDQLRCITTNHELRITFANEPPLILVAATKINCGVDGKVLISQANAQIISILTGKTLKSVFEQRPTFDLKRLLTGSEKLIDTLVDIVTKPLCEITSESRSPSKAKCLNDGVLAFLSASLSTNRSVSNAQTVIPRYLINRVTVPVLLLSGTVRDSVTNVLNTCSSSPSMLGSLLFFVKNGNVSLITLCNFHSKINPLDIQLIYSLIVASEGQLSSVESLWLPICLPRFDSTAFLHAHLSYLNNEFCLVLLTTDRENFHKCQHIKDTILDRLAKIRLVPSKSHLNELAIPQLQYLWYQSQRHSVLWQQSRLSSLSPLTFYVAGRMLNSHLKTFWLRTEKDNILLGWHSPSFQLYAQFDVTTTQLQALNAIQSIIKWIKKEEDKFVIKDYS